MADSEAFAACLGRAVAAAVDRFEAVEVEGGGAVQAEGGYAVTVRARHENRSLSMTIESSGTELVDYRLGDLFVTDFADGEDELAEAVGVMVACLDELARTTGASPLAHPTTEPASDRPTVYADGREVVLGLSPRRPGWIQW